ncbi:hypothetical protein KM043_012950 [Ampulex compressa]|nr:hypothetical protein KM043_012950 [Ampulex compressa]
MARRQSSHVLRIDTDVESPYIWNFDWVVEDFVGYKQHGTVEIHGRPKRFFESVLLMVPGQTTGWRLTLRVNQRLNGGGLYIFQKVLGTVWLLITRRQTH